MDKDIDESSDDEVMIVETRSAVPRVAQGKFYSKAQLQKMKKSFDDQNGDDQGSDSQDDDLSSQDSSDTNEIAFRGKKNVTSKVVPALGSQSKQRELARREKRESYDKAARQQVQADLTQKALETFGISQGRPKQFERAFSKLEHDERIYLVSLMDRIKHENLVPLYRELLHGEMPFEARMPDVDVELKVEKRLVKPTGAPRKSTTSDQSRKAANRQLFNDIVGRTYILYKLNAVKEDLGFVDSKQTYFAMGAHLSDPGKLIRLETRFEEIWNIVYNPQTSKEYLEEIGGRLVYEHELLAAGNYVDPFDSVEWKFLMIVFVFRVVLFLSTNEWYGVKMEKSHFKVRLFLSKQTDHSVSLELVDSNVVISDASNQSAYVCPLSFPYVIVAMVPLNVMSLLSYDTNVQMQLYPYASCLLMIALNVSNGARYGKDSVRIPNYVFNNGACIQDSLIELERQGDSWLAHVIRSRELREFPIPLGQSVQKTFTLSDAVLVDDYLDTLSFKVNIYYDASVLTQSGTTLYASPLKNMFASYFYMSFYAGPLINFSNLFSNFYNIKRPPDIELDLVESTPSRTDVSDRGTPRSSRETYTPLPPWPSFEEY